MSNRLRTFAAALSLLLAGLHSAAAQTTPAAAAGDDEKALRQIVKQLEDAWNAHDGKAFAAPFAPDADYVVVNGLHVKGREEIESGHTQIFTTVYKESRNAATVKGVRMLRPDVAVVHVEWNMEPRPGAEKARAMNTLVFTKDGGKWSIAAFHNTPVQTTQR